MNHRLRHVMAEGTMFASDMLRGTVEMDETYIGARNKRGGKEGRPGLGSHKTPVVALVERGGRVRAFPMPRVTSNNISLALTKHASKHARLVTDEFIAYVTPGKAFPTHDRIRHRDKEYVRGDVHTNTVEGFFSLLKRGINGSFHHVSKGHLFRYVDEFAFRYNTRVKLGYSDADRAAILVLKAEGKRLTYTKGRGASAA